MPFKSTFYTKPSAIHGNGCFTGIPLEPGMRFPIHAHESDEETQHTFWNDEETQCYTPIGPFKCLNHHRLAKAQIVFDDTYGWMLEIIRSVQRDREVTIHYGPDWK